MSRPRRTKESREAEAKDAFRLEVKLQRVRLGMTQGALANEVDMDSSVLSKCLSEPDKLSVERLRKIAQALNMDPLIILGLIGYDPVKIQKNTPT